jgi:hypothetical protein
MLRFPVESTNLYTVGYDGFREVLEIEFRQGAVYEYHKVPSEVYYALISSESIGTYFAENVRDRYETVKTQDARKKGEG